MHISILLENSLIARVTEFVVLKHGEQKRKGGVAYYTHPIAVSSYLIDRGYGIEHALTALLHDIKEDTDTTDAEILAICGAYGKIVLHSIDLLTKDKDNYNEDEYYGAIIKDYIARPVKLYDRVNNIVSLDTADEEFRERYIEETITTFPKLCKRVTDTYDLGVALSKFGKVLKLDTLPTVVQSTKIFVDDTPPLKTLSHLLPEVVIEP